MKNEEKNDRLPDFDWEEHLEHRMTFDDSHLVESGTPFIPPVWEVGERARQMADMLLRELRLDFTTEDVDAFFDPSDSELHYGDAQDDESLFEAVRENLTTVIDFWENAFEGENRPAPTTEEKKALIARLYEFNMVDGRIIPDEEYDAYMDGMEE